MTFVADNVEIKYDKLCLIPLGGQSEIGKALWALMYAGKILLIDAGASYPGTSLPGVDLLLPNTNFLEMNQDKIVALLLTNGQEEHCGAVPYLLRHLKIPRIMAPPFVAALLTQRLNKYKEDTDLLANTVIDTIETRKNYKIGNFQAEWVQVNDAIADACALKIITPEGLIIYTSSFKLDQTPIDGRQMDMACLAEAGDQGVLALISDSAGAENPDYTLSEKMVSHALEKHVRAAKGRIIVVLPGTHTLRLQVLFDLAKLLKKRVILYGEDLIQTAVAAVITANLQYERAIEANLAHLKKLADQEVLILATGEDGDALAMLHDLAHSNCKDLSLKSGDTVIFSSEIYPGESRKVAIIMDQFLSAGIQAIISNKGGVHVSNHAGREELKLMLNLTKPKFFIPAIGEGRHIMHHARIGKEFGLNEENIFSLKNGQILEIGNGLASVIGSVEAESVYFNRGQAESVTAFSVSERRSLSMEGVLNLGIILTSNWQLAQTPILDGAALGFLQSSEWEKLKEELLVQISELIDKERGSTKEISSLRTSIRDLVSKSLRSRMYAKPTIIVTIHELSEIKSK